jgi:hypothetical protein
VLLSSITYTLYVKVTFEREAQNLIRFVSEKYFWIDFEVLSEPKIYLPICALMSCVCDKEVT